MNKKHVRVLARAVVLVGLSCACDDRENHDQPASCVAGSAASDTFVKHADGTEPAGACEWPSNLAPINSTTREVCHAARAYLKCEAQGGAVQVHCASDDFVSCATAAEIEYPVKNCESHCGKDEYAAFCGGIGPGPVPSPPEGCHSSLANPGGIVMYCCPCS